MNRDALKFTDLDAFMSVMQQQGMSQQVEAILYEEENLPYCSAYLLPLELLPTTFDLSLAPEFGGSLTKVYEVNYIGTEQFFTDFMIYPLSRIGYVEVDGVSPITFVSSTQEDEQDWRYMIYVINLEDGGGQEFFYTVDGRLVSLATASDEQPQEFKTHKQVDKKIDQIRDRYPPICRLYPIERNEFDRRRSKLQTTPPTDTTSNAPTD